MKLQEEIRTVMTTLFGENWREELFRALEPAKDMEFGSFYKKSSRVQKLSIALTYVSESVKGEAWKIRKVLSFQAKEEKFGDATVVYGDWDTFGPKENYVTDDSEEPGIFKAVREDEQWRYFFRDDKLSPWEEYVLP